MTIRLNLFFLLLLLSITSLSAQELKSKKYWIFFRDKTLTDLSLQKTIQKALPERTIERRLKNRSLENLVDTYDIPVTGEYIHSVKSLGIQIITVSRWFNAVSAYLSPAQKVALENLPAVAAVREVAHAQQNTLFKHDQSADDFRTVTNPDYGSSYAQNAIINTPAAHQRGYSGNGVLIGMIDTGFNLDHAAIRNVHVVDDSDFVQNDKDVSENTDGKSNSSHGTYVLSAIAGNDPGRLIGTAYGASYLLARTENDDGIGQKAEEDHWVSALEWLEEKGADIISSSISFFDDFQSNSDNYTLADLDGRTALTTIATNIAFDKGVLVFNSAGNMGARGSGYLGTPSDGKKMIAVGAVYGDSSVTTFSSKGPTSDGRKKPDVAALGYNVKVVANDTSHYDNLSGTSLSTPLVAGLAALALEANPKWSAKQLYDAIKKTASAVSKPNNNIGYGIPDALKALNYDPSGSMNPFVKNVIGYPNPSSGPITISFRPLATASFSIKIYNSIGQYVATVAHDESAQQNVDISRSWNGKNERGHEVSSGVYFFRISLGGKSTSDRILIVK